MAGNLRTSLFLSFVNLTWSEIGKKLKQGNQKWMQMEYHGGLELTSKCYNGSNEYSYSLWSSVSSVLFFYFCILTVCICSFYPIECMPFPVTFLLNHCNYK